MASYLFNIYEVDSAFYSSGTGTVLGSDAISIKDDDQNLDRQPADDSGGNQSISFQSGGTVDAYRIDYVDVVQVNGNDPTVEVYTMVAMVDGAYKFFVLSPSSSFAPSPGDALNIVSYTGFSSAAYEDIQEANCLANGTLIETPSGEVPIECLRVGDLVETADRGSQPIRWIGQRHLDKAELARAPNLMPILIRSDGPFAPERPLFVSAQHRMLVITEHGAQALVAAKHLADAPGPAARWARGRREVTYFHLLFDRHEVIFAEGVPVESLFLGRMAVRSMDREEVSEILQFFPSLLMERLLQEAGGVDVTTPARPIMTRKDLACAKLAKDQERQAGINRANRSQKGIALVR